MIPIILRRPTRLKTVVNRGIDYLRISAACFPSFFKSRSNVSRSFFEKAPATSSIAAACSPNPRVISARPFGVSSTFGYPLSNEGVQITSQAILENPIDAE
jgi:hypothetical protein